jgi:hypothetical protein
MDIDGLATGGHDHESIATGFDFEPLSDGNVCIEFYGDDGKTLSFQVVTASVVESMPLVATVTGVALREGAEAAGRIFAKLSAGQDE